MNIWNHREYLCHLIELHLYRDCKTNAYLCQHIGQEFAIQKKATVYSILCCLLGYSVILKIPSIFMRRVGFQLSQVYLKGCFYQLRAISLEHCCLYYKETLDKLNHFMVFQVAWWFSCFKIQNKDLSMVNGISYKCSCKLVINCLGISCLRI